MDSAQLKELFGPRAAREIVHFGNHHLKYFRAIDKGIEGLRSVAPSGLLHLTEPSLEPLEGMRIIRTNCSEDQALTLLGAYFAHQFLLLNAQWSGSLRNLPRGALKSRHLRRLVVDIESGFKRLVRAYLDQVMEALDPDLKLPPFCIANVGALTDHDDVDAVIVANGEDGAPLGHTLSVLQKQCLKNASKLHLHLSEYLRFQRPWGSVDEYRSLLEQELKNFVVVGQIVAAGYLWGSRTLFHQFRHEVYKRYFYRGGFNKFHEGFIRAAISGLNSVLNQERDPEIINPKEQIYRPVKGVMAALRTVHQVDPPSVPMALQALAEKDQVNGAVYEELTDAYCLNEVFRYLFNLYVVQEDAISLTDPTMVTPLAEIAEVLQCTDKGDIADPLEAFLFNYEATLDKTGRACRHLLGALTKHVKEINVFRYAKDRVDAGSTDNLAEALLDLLKGYRGNLFWEDVVDSLREDPVFLDRALQDTMRLPGERRQELVRALILLMSGDVRSLVRFINLISSWVPVEVQEPPNQSVEQFARTMADCFRAFPYKFEAYIELSYQDPGIVHQMVGLLPEGSLRELRDLLEGSAAVSPRAAGALDKHLAFEYLSRRHSRYFGRFIERVLEDHPEFLEVAEDPKRARHLCRKVVDQAFRSSTAERRRLRFGQYYDMEFVRLGLRTFMNHNPESIDNEYRWFNDKFIEGVLDAALIEVLNPEELAPDPGGLAFFSVGGSARGESFHNDYDYLAVVHAEDRSQEAYLLDYFNRALRKVNRSIMRQAMVPHNRIAEEMNTYAVSLRQLGDYLMEDRQERFIDEAEMLDTRFVAGDPEVALLFRQKIVEEIVLKRADGFIDDMLGEIRDRRGGPIPQDEVGVTGAVHIKEDPGGLREINLLLTILKARFAMYGSNMAHLFSELRERLPSCVPDLDQIRNAYRFLRRVRDIYRLTIAYDEEIHPDHLSGISTMLPFQSYGSDLELYEDIIRHMGVVQGCTDRIVRCLPRRTG